MARRRCSRSAAVAASPLRVLLAAALVCGALSVPSPQRRPSASGISSSRWRSLGARCDADRDCAVPYSRCVAGACACQPYYARYNDTRCLPSTLLGFECLVREQCSLKVANSSCIHGLCRCEPGFLQFRRHTCLSPAKPGDVCYSDAHCRLWDANSHCHFLIPKLFGRCGCNAHMVPHGSACVPSQEEDFPPEAPADPSTGQPSPSTTTTTTTTTTAPTTTKTAPTTAKTAPTTTTTAPTTTKTAPTTTTTTAPTTTKTEAPHTLSHTTTPAAITSTTEGISAPSTTAPASTTQSQEGTSTTSPTDEVWSSAAPPSESVEPLAVSFSTGEAASVTGNETDVSIKYPVPSSYPWSTTEDPYRDVTAEVEAETSPLMADATSPPVSSTQSDEPDVLSSSAPPFEATENTLDSSEAPVETSSQSEPAGDESDPVASPTAQSIDASTYSSPEAQWTTPKSESYSEDSIDASSPITVDFVDSQAPYTTEATASVPSHPPPFSIGTDLTFDANYATSTDNQPSFSNDDSWISSSSAYSEPVSTTQDTSVSTDTAWISSSAVPDPIVTTTEGTESATNDAEIASPSTEVATPTQETPGGSSLEPILQDDTEDISEESLTLGEESSDTTNKQSTVEGVPEASESLTTPISPSASIVQVTSVTDRVEPSDTTNKQSTVQGQSVASSESVPTSSSSSAPLVQVTSAEKDSTEEDMMLSATSFSAGVWPTAVSLGLSCVSDLQCQTADPHSRCIDGACDCVHRANGSDACWAGNRGCHPNTFQCRSSGACVSWFFVCDGRRDCADGSDEECSGSGGCPPLSFRCASDGRCVSRAARCDGNTDCLMGEDEQGCNQRAACPQFTFACAAGGNASCLPDYELCNAVVSCADGSDEPRWCRVPPPSRRLRMRGRPASATGPRCPFRCDNGRCRSTAILCSGRDGCGDGSDEARCAVCKCAPASD